MDFRSHKQCPVLFYDLLLIYRHLSELGTQLCLMKCVQEPQVDLFFAMVLDIVFLLVSALLPGYLIKHQAFMRLQLGPHQVLIIFIINLGMN